MNLEAQPALPPVAELGMGAMALVVVGGIYMAAHIPGGAPLAPAVVLLCVATAVVALALGLLSRVPRFAWRHFRLVFGYTLLSYLVIAGMIEYSFVADGTRGAPLLVLSLMLALFAVDIPMILGFSVARYQPA
jgi:hypothetical protein